jgi:hypothetical protein
MFMFSRIGSLKALTNAYEYSYIWQHVILLILMYL